MAYGRGSAYGKAGGGGGAYRAGKGKAGLARGGRGGGGGGGGSPARRGGSGSIRGGYGRDGSNPPSSTSSGNTSPDRRYSAQTSRGGRGGHFRGSGVRWEETHDSSTRSECGMTEARPGAEAESGTGMMQATEGSAEGEEEGSDESEKRWDDRKILSLHSPSGYNLAAAFWEPNEHKLYVLEDTKDTTAWDLALLVMEQTSPEVVIMGSNSQHSLVERVQAYCEENKATLSLQVRQTFTLPSATYALSQARLPDATPLVQRVSGSDDSTMDNVDHGTAGKERATAGMGQIRLSLVKLGAWVNVDAPAAVCAAGSMLTYLQKLKVGSAAFDGGAGIELDGIESLSLDRHMLINQDALNSLAIFDVESHAYSHNTQKKAALSLFGLLNTCVTPSGKRLLHTWHLRPLLDLPAIRARHAAVGFFSHMDNQHGAELLRNHMRRIGNVSRVMNLLRRGRGKVGHWRTLAESLTASMLVRDQLVGMIKPNRVDIVERVIRAINQELFNFVCSINAIIDWDASKDSGRACVKRGVDEYLDECRLQFAQLSAQLDAVSSRIGQTIDRDFFDSLVVKYIPQLGFLVVIRRGDKRVPPPPGWQISFEADDAEYYKSEQMHHLDEHFGDLENNIIDREIEIIQDLVEGLKMVDKDIMHSNEVIAELDCLLALAFAAVQYDLRCPLMSAEPVIHIQNGRHFLQELTVQQYIANDAMMQGGQGGEFCSMIIVTGANGSGKSAYGKQIALIAFMAQIGSFVPAEKAEIGVCDKIYTRLQTKESVSRTGSAFMIDLSQVSHALRGATERSLIILDEFGKGTNAADGAGLLAGVIEHLINGVRPRTVVLTHFHELFTQQFLDPEMPILYCHMRTLMQEGGGELTYLFKLVPTISVTSNAAECALMHGIPTHVVERAREVTRCVTTFQLASLLDQHLTQEEIDELRQAEALAKAFLEWEIGADEEDVMDKLKEVLEEVEGVGEVKSVADEEGEGGGGVRQMHGEVEHGAGVEDESMEYGVVEEDIGQERGD